MKRLAVIGDVHGSSLQLGAMLESAYLDGREVVFVGDLIDRGDGSSKVLELVIEFIQGWPYGTTLLRGNHEQDLLHFLDTGDVGKFVQNGGLSTVGSYYESVPQNVLAAFRRYFPYRHRQLLQESRLYYETGDVLVSHMGFDPQRPDARDLDAMVMQSHHGLFHMSSAEFSKLTICGHYAQQDSQPYVSDMFICIDTGCGMLPGAPLTAILLPERRIVQTDFRGETK